MEKNNLTAKSPMEKLRELWSKNSLYSTLFALVVMVLLQMIVHGTSAGSIGGMFTRMGMAWLNILRNNVFAGIIALGMCFAIISGGIDLCVDRLEKLDLSAPLAELKAAVSKKLTLLTILAAVSLLLSVAGLLI